MPYKGWDANNMTRMGHGCILPPERGQAVIVSVLSGHRRGSCSDCCSRLETLLQIKASKLQKEMNRQRTLKPEYYSKGARDSKFLAGQLIMIILK